MTARYRLQFYDPDGTLFYRGDEFAEMACTRVVNGPGLLTAVLDGSHQAVARLAKRSMVELWRDDAEYGVPWTREFCGLMLGEKWQWPKGGDSQYAASFPGDLWRLGTRVVDWYAGYASRSEFSSDPAETIMKLLVRYNAGADATMANGRKREGVISGVSVAADAGGGTVRDWFCHGDNLLKTLQELALVGGGDFDLVKTGAAAWEFRFYAGQLGVDRSATVLFAVERGNIVDVRYEADWREEKSAACVWGQNTGVARAYLTVLGGEYAADNDVEVYADARDIAVDLQGRGEKVLSENAARVSLTFEVAQTPGCMYRKHYDLGDLVTVRHPRTGVDAVYQVYGATLGKGAADETVGVELRSVGRLTARGGVTEKVIDRLGRVERAVGRLERMES